MELISKLTLFLSFLSIAGCTCDRDLLTLAFRSVAGFQPPPPTTSDTGCRTVRELRLPSKNLTGVVAWALLVNISTLLSIDLSGNALEGSIPSAFWSTPGLAEVNLAGNRLGGALRFQPSTHLRLINVSSNRFTGASGLSGFPGLETLDLSRNYLSLIPTGLRSLRRLRYLDVSLNSMEGDLASDLPRVDQLGFLNVSCNNFTGRLDSGYLTKFGSSAFIKTGSLSFAFVKVKEHRSRAEIASAASAAVVVVVLGGVLGCLLYVRMKRRRKGFKEGDDGWLASTSGEEASWVAAARSSSAVVVFEKPLMELTFSDLAEATSGFGRESQLSEGGGRSGKAYRAVLAGEMHVVVRLVEGARELDEQVAADGFRQLARLRHPNILPVLGFCIPGKEKLLLYEYMERGDLHRWLHELPSGKPDVDDCTTDTWDHHLHHHWPTRYNIALGVARGLAFLHQGWAGSTAGPTAHGRLVPSNILLGDDFEPRVADFASAAADGATTEGDVYCFGAVVVELLTGRGDDVAVEWARGMVRAGRAVEAVDPRLRLAGGPPEWEGEMAECIKVGYLCTAPSPEKRPTMQQVVGLIKDVRPTGSTTAATTSSWC